jgi:hypothetical protein
VRTLQEGFQRHLGMSPMAYLRVVRLRSAHRDLHSALTPPWPALRTAGGSPTEAVSPTRTRGCTAKHRCKPCTRHAELTNTEGAV